MAEDFNPKYAPGSPPGDENDPLSSALDELLAGRFLGFDHAIPSPGTPFGTAGPGMNPHPPPVLRWPAGPCPSPEEWILLTQENSDPEEAKKVNNLLAHASSCHGCAEQLRALSADLSPEEAILLARLTSVTPSGQRDLAARLAATPVATASAESRPAMEKSPRSSRVFVWTSMGLAALLLIAVSLGIWWRSANSPERLLAQAYTRDRIFALRMPGGGYAEVTPNAHLRGANASREPASLREARDRIDRQLESAPDDSHLLELEARSDILEEKFDPAVEILERLVAAGPITASLLVDDASAYFQRGQATGSDTDRATALDYLRRADELAPGDTVVLFNEAIAMEDRGQLINAVETWNRYLRLERDPQWQAEGRRRLQALEDKLNQIKSHSSGAVQNIGAPPSS